MIRRLAALLLLSVSAPALSKVHFEAYEGNDSVSEGHGGTRTTTDGIDFWTFGTPPHRFQVLGIITDKRGTGLLSKQTVAAHNVAEQVRTVGGDAAIVLGSNTETTGYTGGARFDRDQTGVSAYGWASPVNRRTTKLIVIKYLDR